MNKILLLVLVNAAIAFAGLPLPLALQKKFAHLMKDDPPGEAKIVGGSNTASGGRPFQVLLKRSGSFICGGSFIGTKTVLTAAHCVDGYENSPSSFTVGYNSLTQAGVTNIAVSKVVKHSSYNSNTINYDYAILQLSSAFTAGTNAAVIGLPSSGYISPSGTSVTVSGWGRTTGGGSVSTTLRQTTQSSVLKASCQSTWGSVNTITDYMKCAFASASSACNGDSGGPLTAVINGVTTLVGVVSWGPSGCGLGTYPTVYARVSAAISWINSNSAG